MAGWTQEEITAMRLADAEIDESFCMTREEIAESRERDEIVLDGQLTFRDLARKRHDQAYFRRYYEIHGAELREKMKKRRDAKPKEERERCRSWSEKNAEYARTYQKAYYEENKPYLVTQAIMRNQVNKAYRAIMAEEEAI